jgi:ATP-dependent protease Clp ATPase subunit
MQIMEILTNQEMPKWIKRFQALDCQLDLDAGALGRCSNYAFESKTGARGAASLLRRAMDDIFYEASKGHYSKVRVDANVVQSGRLEIEVVDAVSA